MCTVRHAIHSPVNLRTLTVISEPVEAETEKLLIEELLSKLCCQQRHELYDCQAANIVMIQKFELPLDTLFTFSSLPLHSPYSPLSIFGKLNDRRKE